MIWVIFSLLALGLRGASVRNVVVARESASGRPLLPPIVGRAVARLVVVVVATTVVVAAVVAVTRVVTISVVTIAVSIAKPRIVTAVVVTIVPAGVVALASIVVARVFGIVAAGAAGAAAPLGKVPVVSAFPPVTTSIAILRIHHLKDHHQDHRQQQSLHVCNCLLT